jgi:hypothetical protein
MFRHKPLTRQKCAGVPPDSGIIAPHHRLLFLAVVLIEQPDFPQMFERHPANNIAHAAQVAGGGPLKRLPDGCWKTDGDNGIAAPRTMPRDRSAFVIARSPIGVLPMTITFEQLLKSRHVRQMLMFSSPRGRFNDSKWSP